MTGYSIHGRDMCWQSAEGPKRTRDGFSADVTTFQFSSDLNNAINAVGGDEELKAAAGCHSLITETRPQTPRYEREQIIKALFDHQQTGISIAQLRVLLPAVAHIPTILKDFPLSQLRRSELNGEKLETVWRGDIFSATLSFDVFDSTLEMEVRW
jgi:hypothetical protein